MRSHSGSAESARVADLNSNVLWVRCRARLASSRRRWRPTTSAVRPSLRSRRLALVRRGAPRRAARRVASGIGHSSVLMPTHNRASSPALCSLSRAYRLRMTSNRLRPPARHCGRGVEGTRTRGRARARAAPGRGRSHARRSQRKSQVERGTHDGGDAAARHEGAGVARVRAGSEAHAPVRAAWNGARLHLLLATGPARAVPASATCCRPVCARSGLAGRRVTERQSAA